ncbi:MAG: glycosyltransferase family 39 protein, partial [Patescibacteria group bacterium]
MTLIDKLEKSRDFWFLLITSFVFFLLRLPSLFEPYWYGDEGIYQTLGSAIRHGRILYEGAWDNKPPLLYIVYAIFNGDQFYVRALSLIFGLFSVTAFYFLAKKLFGENKEQSKIAMWSAGIFAFLFAIPFMEGNIANSENFMLLLIIFSGFLILSEKLNPKILLISGLILGIAFLFKIVAIFDFTAFAVFIIISKIDLPKRDLLNLNLLKKIFNLLAPFVLGFAIPILITAFFFIGPQFKYFFQATFLQNVGYVGWGNKLIIPQGYMILKLILLAGFTT